MEKVLTAPKALGADLCDAVLGRYRFDGRDWSTVDIAERRSIVRRLIFISLFGILLTTVVVGVETLAMIRLVVTGGSLSVPADNPHSSLGAFIAAVVLGAMADMAVAGYYLAPQLRWFLSGRRADIRRRRSVQMLPIYQATATLVSWTVACVAYLLVGGNFRLIDMVVTASAFGLGAVSAACVTYMVSERAARPLAAAAMGDAPFDEPILGIRQRMLVVWLVCSGVPLFGMIMINVGRVAGWIPPSHSTVDIPIVTLAVICLGSGARSVVLVSRSLTDPLRGMRRAIDEVNDGNFNAKVDVYDSSELGMLQHDFNEMVAGVAEREQIRDLFERHVGGDVAKQAMEHGSGMHGGNTEVGVLFVDIAGSTQFAEQQNPELVAETLNNFFGIVADVVDAHRGFINKFEGDAALAVFGAPIELADPAGAALAAARELGEALRNLPLHCGIGVSAGTVFAGNIGAETRYEYTVIGDPVNECARLSEVAKNTESNILAGGGTFSASVYDPDLDPERAQWSSIGTLQLRGRRVETEIFAPDTAIADLEIPRADHIDAESSSAAVDLAVDGQRSTGLIGSLLRLPISMLRPQR